MSQTFIIRLPNGGDRSIGFRRTGFFAGLALLRLYLAWENFLERVFVRYMCGAQSNTGYSPGLALTLEPNISAALYKLLNPLPNKTYNYLNWNISSIVNRANYHFVRGEPFSIAINAYSQPLQDIEVIRNAFAHRSNFAIQQFRNVVRRELGYVPRGSWPGSFLLKTHPVHAPVTYLDYYADVLINMGGMIVP
jgi:hypothetical protein